MHPFHINEHEPDDRLRLEDGTPVRLLANDREYGVVIGCKNALFKMSNDGYFCDLFGRKHRVYVHETK